MDVIVILPLLNNEVLPSITDTSKEGPSIIISSFYSFYSSLTTTSSS
jgi:hypothetical protein